MGGISVGRDVMKKTNKAPILTIKMKKIKTEEEYVYPNVKSNTWDKLKIKKDNFIDNEQ